MSEIYSEQDVLEGLTYISIKNGNSPNGVGEVRWAIVINMKGANVHKRRQRFYANHSNKWVLRKLKLLKKQGLTVDKKFRWFLSDSQIIAQKLLGNLP